MSEAFCTETSSHIPVQPLQGFLQIECADGEFLLYSGYMKVDITAAGVGLKEKQAQPCLLLVVSERRYNAKVPLLLERNSLERFLDTSREQRGNKFLQTATLHTPWCLSFRSMVLGEKGTPQKKKSAGNCQVS